MVLGRIEERFRKKFSGEAGERELDQVILVLFSQYLKSLGKNSLVYQAGPGLCLGAQILCLQYRSRENVLSLGLFRPLERSLQGVLVVSPGFSGASFVEHFVRKDLQDDGWKKVRHLPFYIWDQRELLSRFQQFPALWGRYFPDLVPGGKDRLRQIQTTRSNYDRELIKLNSRIQFVGMSVYKEEASAGVDMEKIYIPVRVVPEGADDGSSKATQRDPLTLLTAGARHVILGDPGSGKSTLLRFLALAGMKPQLLQRYKAPRDDRLPLLITLRRYAEALEAQPYLSLFEYAFQTLRSDLNIPDLERDFFDHYLYAGKGLILLDGVDELPNPDLKAKVKQRVFDLLTDYPGNTMVVASRMVGYDREIRFDDLGFTHYLMARLSIEDIKRFVNDWYRSRTPNRTERDRHSQDLLRILEDPDSRAIQELAENPLLLTIICLVHRIDAELPDERVVLYQKCTETLLNTWHNWKLRGERDNLQSRSKVERRNRSRMEAIAYWMHVTLEEASSTEIRRAVVPFDPLCDFLAQYIEENEKPRDEAPSDIAEKFLGFIKDRAGLLIEVGNGQYSFLHLTFQEYLTATYLRKSGEKAGMQVVWPFIEKRCGNPRWHEVIRLLVAALERSESQAFLLERILPRMTEPDAFERTLLAGGCLIDRVDAAEDFREEILSALLQEAANAEGHDRLGQVVRILRALEDRSPEDRELLRRLAQVIVGRETWWSPTVQPIA